MELKVGEKVIWHNSKEWSASQGEEVIIMWFEPHGPLEPGERVVLVDVPNRAYHRRFVLVPARVLMAKPKQCTGQMQVIGHAQVYFCNKLEGHNDLHECRISLVTVGKAYQEAVVHWRS